MGSETSSSKHTKYTDSIHCRQFHRFHGPVESFHSEPYNNNWQDITIWRQKMTLTLRNFLILVFEICYVSGQGYNPNSLGPLPDVIEEAISRAEQLLENGIAAAAPRYDVGTKCLNHTEMFIEALVQRQQWALRSKLLVLSTLILSICYPTE